MSKYLIPNNPVLINSFTGVPGFAYTTAACVTFPSFRL